MSEMEEDKNLVRVMSREEERAYDDVTVEGEVLDDGEEASSGERPASFNEAYEDNSQRQEDFRQHFRSYGGSGSRTRVYTFGLGNGLSAWQKWRYRIIFGLAVAAIIAFLVFVALPVVAIGVVIAMIAYLLYAFFA